MMYFLWSLPALLVIGVIASGRASTTMAALLGLLVAVPVALFTAPDGFGPAALGLALLRGAWIGWVIAPYILGGLLFWQIAARNPASASDPLPGADLDRDNPLARRRWLFFSCFLVGPFAEAATGFGVGMIGTVVLIRALNLPARQVMVFALMSQTLIPWGAMGSGTLLASAYARMAPTQLALYSLIPVALLMLVWLPLYWQTARQAGIGASAQEHLREVGWLVLGLTLLSVSTALLGPETALLAAYGPLIVLRFVLDRRPDKALMLTTAGRALPYLVVIACLLVTRLVPSLKLGLADWGKLRPFIDLPPWSPFFHAGSWMVLGAIVLAVVRRGGEVPIWDQLRSTWTTGRQAILTVFLFAMMAEMLAGSGISRAFGSGMYMALRDWTLLVTPLLAGTFGILANSGNAPNSLFMASQLSLALQAGVDQKAAAALLHVSGTAMSMLSPVRMSIAAGLARGAGQERVVYAQLLPFAAAAFAILLLLAVAIRVGG